MKNTLFSACLLIALAGTACTPTIYKWRGYQQQVYYYMEDQDVTMLEQIETLERDLAKIKSDGKVPPGYHAHLGLLYSHVSKDDQAVEQFLAEKELFPESSTFMDFLLKKSRKGE